MTEPAVEEEGGPAPERGLTREQVRGVSAAIEAGSADAVKALVRDLHEADLADLLELLRPEERQGLVRLLGDAFDAGVFAELDENLRDELLGAMAPHEIAEAVRGLDTDDAVYLLEDLGEPEQDAVLARLPPPDRAALRASLDYGQDTAGRLMQRDFVAVPPFWTVGHTIDYMRDEDDLPEDFYEIFVVDASFHLIGTVPVSHVLRARRPVRMRDIMDKDRPVVRADEDQEQVAYRFEQYNLVSAPVLDADERVVGVITIDDVVDVIQEEAKEDLHRLAGVGDEELTDTVWRTSRSRVTWLGVNLVTAILASLVISLFGATIEQMVALAILMPIVASMGGIAATQTATVAVRALATKNLLAANARRVIIREALVGLLNGVVFAVIMGAVGALWFGSVGLGAVLATAMVVNLFVAGLAGILVPLTLERSGIDPAIASSAFVTTVTDVVGFFAFLGLASIWLR